MKNEYQNNFKRYEKKYILNKKQYALFIENTKPYITEDAYGLHTICNLYLDTENFQLIRTSIEKPVYKEKIRLRSYGVPHFNDNVFLELKKKYKGIVYKRRISLPLNEAMDYINFKKPPKNQCQIFKEIDWSMNLYNPTPKAFIAYDRTAFFGNDDSEFRVTFDNNIRFRETTLELSKGDYGNFILEPNLTLMELKISESMPLWLSYILSELKIFPVSFSKYGTCYKNYLCQQKGGIICA